MLLKPVFHLATLFARREANTRIRHRDWLKLAGEKIRREQVGTVPTFLSVRANKVAKCKTGFTLCLLFGTDISSDKLRLQYSWAMRYIVDALKKRKCWLKLICYSLGQTFAFLYLL